MTSSFTFIFSGVNSILQADFLPEIRLDEDCNYSCALLDLIIKKSDLKEIAALGVIHINCDIVSGSYINGQRSHTIHQFTTSASHVKSQTFLETPRHLNYLPVKVKSFSSIQISIFDDKGKQVNLQGCNITCRINIKRDSN